MEVFAGLLESFGLPVALIAAMAIFIYKLWLQSVEREKTLMTEITENRLVNQKFAEIIGKYEIELSEIKTDVKDIKESLNISK